ncbi:MAG TPA: glycosyltransferase family 39 protein [Chloroflexota bacterium]|nr:glycosyltransferase family 39 protein [Chloroflexota bacterium]
MIARRRIPVGIGLVLLAYLVLAVLYAIRVPTWNAPDEPAHYNFIRSIAVDHRLPILEPGDYNQARLSRLVSEHFPAGVSIAGLKYESHQPPLYYLIASPVFLATQGLGERRQVVALRFVTVLIGALFIAATYRLASLIFPKGTPYPLAAAAFVAFIPMHVFMDAAIDNDALAELMVCLTLIVLVKDLTRPRAPRHDWLAGALVGLSILTKLVAGITAVLVVVGFLGSALLSANREKSLREWPLRVFRSGLVAALISGWWFVRNVVIYGIGDPVGLRRHAQVVVGQPLTPTTSLSAIRQMSLTAFHSFWGQFGWMGIPYTNRTYDVLATLSLFVGLGVLVFVWRMLHAPRQPDETVDGKVTALVFSRPQRWSLVLLAFAGMCVFVGVVFYNMRYLQPQGRYLFPTLPGLAVFSVAGIGELIREEHVRLVLTLAALAMVWLCIYSLFQVIGPAFAVASP